MRRRFSLYGFLKNQRYFEPFLWLAFLGRGLDFLDIGLLVALREGVVVALEVPSGAMADAFGRRRIMILSFIAYVLAFPTLAVGDDLALLAAGMAAYGVGDAFRTGTHKAMIFDWLVSHGREDERTAFYGYTRSWSKIGSAVSIVVGAGMVLSFERYEPLFFAAVVPYLLGIVNFLGYPAALDGTGGDGERRVTMLLRSAASQAWGRRGLRRLLLESMGFEGLFHAMKDYLQPVLAVAAVAVFAGSTDVAAWSEARRIALLVGPVYLGLYLLAAVGSRQAHRVEGWTGGAEAAARVLWLGLLGTCILLAGADWLGVVPAVVAAFLLLHVLQNLWRPALVSRIDAHASAREGATVLSVESLMRRLATIVWAPVLGAGVDHIAASGAGEGTGVWLLGLAGVATAMLALLSRAPAPDPG